MISIPTKFRLMNRTWVVEYDKKLKDAHGECHFDDARITLKTKNSVDLTDHSFLHELVHAVLVTLGQERLNRDEAFVDSFAGALHQFLKTKSGTLKQP